MSRDNKERLDALINIMRHMSDEDIRTVMAHFHGIIDGMKLKQQTNKEG